MKASTALTENLANSLTLETQRSLSENPSSKWPNAIRNYLAQKKPHKAIEIYTRNRGHGSRSTVLSAIPLVLKACAWLSMLDFGKASHCETIKSGIVCDVIVGTSLIFMYGRCQDIVSSRKVFDNMPVRNMITWNAMIGGCMRNRDTLSALFLFEEMPERTSVTWNEMIDGYARNGDVAMARRVFESVPEGLKTVVSWTVMVDVYASNRDMESARVVFEGMNERNFYVWSVMISGYFKEGDVVKAREIFDRMSLRNLVNWNSLISGYAQSGMCKEALDAFERMQVEGFKPDEITVTCVLSACAQSGMLDVGKEIHEMIRQKRIELNQFVLNGLVDMYARCGDLSNARLIFEGMQSKNCATWNAMISGFSVNAQYKEAIEFFHRMEESGVKPDNVTFISVISACAHGGFVEEGFEEFSKMEKYGLSASTKHYGCLVDLLGRAGKLQEAVKILKEMPVKPNDIVLGALLGACRIHGDTVMVEYLLELVSKLNSEHDSLNDGHYVLLSNIYAAAERWEMAEGLRVAFSDVGSGKKTGCSAIML